MEEWGVADDFSGEDLSKLQKLEELCSKLKSLCITGVTRIATTAFEVQKMLRETELLSHITSTFRQDSKMYPDSSRKTVARAQVLLCGVAVHFVTNNDKNQLAFYKIVQEVMANLGDVPEMALLLAETFRNNLDLCNQVPEGLVEHFADIIIRERQRGKAVPWYLTCYRCIVSVDKVPVRMNQEKVVEVLQQKSPENMLYLLHDIKADAGNDEDEDQFFEEFMKIATRFKSARHLLRTDLTLWSAMSDNDMDVIFFVRSIELLVALCQGNTECAVTAVVSGLMPTSLLVVALRRIESAEPVVASLHDYKSLCHHVETCFLNLLHFLVYEIDVDLVDTELLTSQLHIEHLTWMLEKLMRVLSDEDLPLRKSDELLFEIPLLAEDVEELTKAILSCIDAFFNGPFQLLTEQGLVQPALQNVIHKYRDSFAEILGSEVHTNAAPSLACRFRDPELLVVALHRTLVATDGSGTRHDISQVSIPKKMECTSPAEEKLRAMLATTRRDPSMQARFAAESADIGRLLMCSADLTDEQQFDYRTAIPTNLRDSLPDGVDFRRNIVKTEDLSRRFVIHCQQNMQTDITSVKRVLTVFLALLATARASEEQAALMKCQAMLVRAGIMQLLIRLLDSQGLLDIVDKSWRLLTEMLEGGGNSKSQHNTRFVQQTLFEVFSADDYSSMWETVVERLDVVGDNVERIREIRSQQAHTSTEMVHLKQYRRDLETVSRIIVALSLMVDGHFQPMQDYLCSQARNMNCYNVLEHTCLLFLSFCKGPGAADSLELQEITVIDQMVGLIMELTQGPNLQNQSFASRLGVIEVIIELLDFEFNTVCECEREVYPSSIRLLKARFAQTLASLLEGRSDNTIHKVMLQNFETNIIRGRIEFVYLFLVFGMVGISSGAVEDVSGSAAVPFGSKYAALLDPKADPTEVYYELIPASEVAEGLLEDLEDKELHELLSEALSLLEVIYMLLPHSDQLKNEIYPDTNSEEVFVDDETLYTTSRRYMSDLATHHKRSIYRQAFNALQRFVRTIEVVLDGRLQHLHFQQPLSAMWYVHGATQENILQTVPYSSPDLKARAFVAMCIDAHRESQLIRHYSRYSVVPPRYLKLAQRYLPDMLHRPFFVFFADDARKMEQLLKASAILSTAIAAHVGMFLTPEDLDTEDENGNNNLVMASPWMLSIARLMCGLHIACSFVWALLALCIKFPLCLQMRGKKDPILARAVILAFVEAVRTPAIFLRTMLVVVCLIAIFGEYYFVLSFLLVDIIWQSEVLGSIVKSVTVMGMSMSITFLGSIILTFVYAAFGFHYFREEYKDYCTDDIIFCTQDLLYQGTRSGIVGLSGMMAVVMPGDRHFFIRMPYDLSYFLLFGVLILNAIVALICDSFSASRKDGEARAAHLATHTFISCINRIEIDAAALRLGISNGFEYHETFLQSKWNYLSFIFYLQEKNPLDYTGPEVQINHMVENCDPQWLPLGRSSLVENIGGVEDQRSKSASVSPSELIELQSQAALEEKAFSDHLANLSEDIADRLSFIHEQLCEAYSPFLAVPTSPSTKKSMTASPSLRMSLALGR
eukprot:TRINITY_DN74049_c0_g1_i1.p1 TRINITY_DN74049_c0_g1~~TRINITY_DN74049_c0_g1_i1.p1  ORF type:complete len:1695 (+),score=273.62 TRINITY_DN74049_c0_g1_i1:399-5087(+)